MFISIKEKLITIKNNNVSETYNLICKYLLDCIANSYAPNGKECAEFAFCSESVLTFFAKKYGYDGFRELSIRIKVETEYYNAPNMIEKNGEIFSTAFRTIVDSTLDWIDVQNEKINILISQIKSAKNIYFLSSYQQMVTTELFCSELQLLGFNAHFNIQRKMNRAWINKANFDDIFIVIAFGLDNQYLLNFCEFAKTKTKNIFLISSISQKHKFETKNSIIIDYVDRSIIWESTRVLALSYLFSKSLELLK